MGAVPQSALDLGINDKEGNSAFRVIVMGHLLDDYMQAARKAGFYVKRFTYDRE